MYHELTILYNDLPRSYLIKSQATNQGAQISFVDTLQDYIREYIKSHPTHPKEEPIKIKISRDGAKMSRTTNFMILSFSLLQTGERVISSKGKNIMHS